MKHTPSRLLACLAVTLLPFAGSVHVLAAQTPTAGGLLYTEAELGGRAYVDRPDGSELARFQDYRDDPAGPILEALRAWWRRDARLVDVRALQVGQRDQRLEFTGISLGRYALHFERDRAPNLLSTNGRMLGDQVRRGEFTLPVPRPHLLEHDQGASLGRTGISRNTDRLALSVTPRPHTIFRAQYSRTNRTGSRPMGMVFGGAGANFREILAPVEQTTHDIRLSHDLATSRYQVGVSYHVSFFENDLDAVVSDNPLVAQPYVAGAYRGRTALEPSNRAQTLAASAGLSLPYRGRVTAAVSFGWRGQNHILLPHTINPSFPDSDLPELRESLEGNVRTLAMNLAARARPVAPVTVSARYRLFDMDDRTPGLVMASRVRSDQAILEGPFERRRYPFARENASADVRWTPMSPVSFGAEYAWERWRRDPGASAGVTREQIPRLTLDVRPGDRVQLHASYLRAERRNKEYAERNDLPSLRRFDRSDRDHERVRVAVQLFPLDALDLSLSYDRGTSDYPDSPYGRQGDREAAWAIHGGWAVSDRVTLHANYVREAFELSQRSRYRGAWPAELDNESFDWIGNTDEAVRTAGFGGTVGVLPRQLDVTFGWDRSRGSSWLRTHNPVGPASPNVANRSSATAVDFPVVAHALAAAHVSLRYRLSDTWLASARYTAERFTNQDFRTDNLAPATGMDVFLANALLGYGVRYFTLTFWYHPWIPGVRRPPL